MALSRRALAAASMAAVAAAAIWYLVRLLDRHHEAADNYDGLTRGEANSMMMASSDQDQHRVASDLAVEQWVHLMTSDSVDIYLQKVPGSKLLAFKGVATLEMHISDVLRPFANLSLSRDWIEMLHDIRAFGSSISDIGDAGKGEGNGASTNITEYFSSHRSDLVYQLFQLPWPIASRELVLKRYWRIETESKSVTFNYHSVDDERFPISQGRVRAISPYTMWRFTAVEQRHSSRIPQALPSSAASPSAEALSSSRSATSILSHSTLIPSLGSIVRKSLLSTRVALSTFTSWFYRALRLFSSMLLFQRRLRAGTKYIQNDYDDGFESANRRVLPFSDSFRKTTIEVECLVDSRGMIPEWFTNYIQRSFPPKAIAALHRLARREMGKDYYFPFVSSW